MNKVNVNKVVDYANLLKENEILHSIIKEVRKYIEEHSEMTNLQINGIENILAFRGNCRELLEILDKVEELREYKN